MKENIFSDRDIKDFLIEKGIKPTLIRIKVLEYLWSTKEHPDAEKIFNEVIKYIPTLSMTSIYNTLNNFVEKGIVIPIKIEEGVVRYDGDTKSHGHFKCVKCGKILDIDIEQDIFKNSIKEGQILEEHIYIIGICNECLNKQEGR
ncbi:MAG: Fur family transcriptional regulator [Brevinematia bacterium]